MQLDSAVAIWSV